MASNYGIKILGEDGTIDTELNNDNIDLFNFLSSDPTAMIVKTALVSGTTYSHGLGYKPHYFVFEVDSVVNPTTYSINLSTLGMSADTTQVTGLPGNCYLIFLAKNY